MYDEGEGMFSSMSCSMLLWVVVVVVLGVDLICIEMFLFWLMMVGQLCMMFLVMWVLRILGNFLNVQFVRLVCLIGVVVICFVFCFVFGVVVCGGVVIEWVILLWVWLESCVWSVCRLCLELMILLCLFMVWKFMCRCVGICLLLKLVVEIS